MGHPTPPAVRQFRTLIEAFNARDWAAYPDVLADDVVLHEGSATVEGIDQVIDRSRSFCADHPTVEIDIEDVIANEHRIAATVSMRCTHGHPRSSDMQELSGIIPALFEDGELVEIWMLPEQSTRFDADLNAQVVP